MAKPRAKSRPIEATESKQPWTLVQELFKKLSLRKINRDTEKKDSALNALGLGILPTPALTRRLESKPQLQITKKKDCPLNMKNWKKEKGWQTLRSNCQMKKGMPLLEKSWEMTNRILQRPECYSSHSGLLYKLCVYSSK